MKTLIIITLWIFPIYVWALDREIDLSSIKDCDQIAWLVDPEDDDKYLLVDNVDVEVQKTLKIALQSMEVVPYIDVHLMQSESIYNGYLLFYKNSKITAVLRVMPFVSNKKALDFCVLKSKQDGIISITKYGEFTHSLLSKNDYRSILAKIAIPARPDPGKLFQVKLDFMKWEGRP